MKVRKLLLALVSLALFGSCEMMKEDVDDTYCGLFVNFKYDYNLQRADMFKDHVGEVTLYVFDSDGRYIKSYENNYIPGMGTLLYDGTYAYCMHITDLLDGNYRFIALANQKSYLETLGTPGAKYRRYDIKAGEDNTSLTVTLDRNTSIDGSNPMVSNVAPMDTIWHGMTGTEPVNVKNVGYNVVTISMMRDTKMLTVGIISTKTNDSILLPKTLISLLLTTMVSWHTTMPCCPTTTLFILRSINGTPIPLMSMVLTLTRVLTPV